MIFVRSIVKFNNLYSPHQRLVGGKEKLIHLLLSYTADKLSDGCFNGDVILTTAAGSTPAAYLSSTTLEFTLQTNHLLHATST